MAVLQCAFFFLFAVVAQHSTYGILEQPKSENLVIEQLVQLVKKKLQEKYGFKDEKFNILKVAEKQNHYKVDARFGEDWNCHLKFKKPSNDLIGKPELQWDKCVKGHIDNPYNY